MPFSVAVVGVVRAAGADGGLRPSTHISPLRVNGSAPSLAMQSRNRAAVVARLRDLAKAPRMRRKAVGDEPMAPWLMVGEECGCLAGTAAWELERAGRWGMAVTNDHVCASQAELMRWLGLRNYDWLHVDLWPKPWRVKFRRKRAVATRFGVMADVLEQACHVTQGKR